MKPTRRILGRALAEVGAFLALTSIISMCLAVLVWHWVVR